MKIKYDIKLIKYMSLFQSRTQASVKDCFEDDLTKVLTFVVLPGQIGKAVGKQGATIKQIEAFLKRKVRVIEFHPELLQFIKNMLLPLRVRDVVEAEGTITIDSGDTKLRGLIIGRNASSLRNLEANVKRYFPAVKEVKVV